MIQVITFLDPAHITTRYQCEDISTKLMMKVQHAKDKFIEF